MNTPSARIAEVAGCLSGYDPEALPVAQAQQIIRSMVAPIDAVEKLALRAALGRVLARDIVSSIDVPAHDNSAMDGYALHGADLDAECAVALKIVGTAFAGRPFNGPVGRGECVGIMTGAIMPDACDSVAPQELVQATGDMTLTVPAGAIQPGANRRLRGEDLQSGSTALARGKILRPADLGLLASLGVAEVPVVPKTARRLFFHRRRIALDRRAARPRLRVRQQPLYAIRHADPARLRSHRSGRGQGRSGDAGGNLALRLRSSRRHRHFRRRLGRRGRLHAANHGATGRSRVLENRDAPRSTAGLRPHRLQRPQRLPVRPARQPGGGHGELLFFRARSLAADDGRASARRCRCCACPRKARSARNRAAPNTSAASWRSTNEAGKRCARPARKAPACCVRCRKPIAWWCWRMSKAMSRLATRSR